MKRRLLLAGMLIIVGVVAVAESATSRRRWRDGTAVERMTGEGWGKYREAMRAARRDRPVMRAARRDRPVYYQPTSTPQTYQSGASIQFQPNHRATRSNNGRLTERQVYTFRETYDQRQSRQAMRSALGEPAESTLTKDRWRIAQTDIYGKPAEDGWFEADYGMTGINWDSQTVRPPTASW